MADNILSLAARDFSPPTGCAQPMIEDELQTLRPLLMQHPNSSDQRLLATIDALQKYVKYLRIVRP